MRRAALLLSLPLLACSAQGSPYFDLVRESRHTDSVTPARRIDLGTPEGRLHLGPGWSDRDRVGAGGVTHVRAVERAAAVHFQAAGDEVRAVRLRCAAPESVGERQVVAVLLNDEPQGTVRLRRGFRPRRLRIDAAALRPGDNRLDLVFRVDPGVAGDEERPHFAACDWIRIVADDEAARAARPAELVDGALHLPAGARLDYPVELRPGTVLRLAGIDRQGLPGSVGLRIRVRTPDGDGATREVEGARLTRGDSVPLEAEGPALLSLETTGTPTPGGFLRIAEATLLAPIEADPPAPELAGARSRLVGTAPSILVYMVDTLRADHLGAYGYDRGTSPRIDAFAADAVVFDRMFAQSGWTRTSVASLMTGLLPPSHDVYGREDKLSGAARTLAGELRDLGYETYAVVTNGIVSQAFGFHGGFDRYDYLRERPDERIHRYSDEVHEAFLEWLDGRGDERPFLAYLHTMDPHSPYTPPEPYRSRFAPEGPRTGLRFPRDARPLAAEDDDFTPERVRDDMVALYDAEIAHNDATFGELMEALRGRGVYDDLVVVLLSDHGEEFLEHGRYEHLKTLYRELIHVPLVVKLPGARNGGARTATTAQHVDLLPTLLQLAGGAVPDWAQGTSLLPALEDPERAWRARSVRSYMRVDTASVASLIRERWHLIREPMLPESPDGRTLELYDLREDPAETRNLARAMPIRTGLLLSDWARDEARDPALLDAETAVIDEELRERLRALGYLR